MIFWKDFIIDDVFGTLLNLPEEGNLAESLVSCRRTRLGRPSNQEDANVVGEQIQETRQEIQPARMVGCSAGLDSTKTARTTRMEADRRHRAKSPRLGGST